MARVSVLSVLIVVVALWCGVSSATASMGVVETFGQEGSGGGQFVFPSGTAINQASGDVYVVDAASGDGAGGQRVEQFSADGTFLRAWGWGVATGAEAFEVCTSSCQAGIRGSGEGQLAVRVDDPLDTSVRTPPQVAVDQADGSVYVADSLNNRVQKFTATGSYVAQFGTSGTGHGQFDTPQGVAVDPVSGDVYVADTNNNRVQRFTSAGVFVGQFGVAGSGDGEFLSPKRVAVDSTGRLHVLDSGNARIQRFAADGSFESVFGPAAVNLCVTNLDFAINPADDHVFVVGCSADFSVEGIIEIDSGGQAVDAHPVALPNPTWLGGLAMNPSTGRLYAADVLGHRMLIFDNVIAPSVSMDSVSDVTAETASFDGTVNPQGPPNTSYQFAYSTDGANWTAVPSSALSIGSGSDDVTVSQVASGLDPNTEYRVRLEARKDFNAANATSGELTFSTSVAPPAVRTLAAGARTADEARLGGEVNPRLSQASYYIEYTLSTDTAYANSSRLPATSSGVEVGAGNSFVSVSQLATGLQAGTEYRFRVVASNVAGTTNGRDRTFTTAKALPAPPAGRAYEMVSPLDKNGGDIDRDLPNSSSTSTSGAAASGDAVAYAAQAQFAGIEGGALQSQYRSVRAKDGSGWATRGISPPLEPNPLAAAVAPVIWSFSSDLSQTVVSTNALLTPEGGTLLGGSWGLYLQQDTGSVSAYRLLSTPASPLPQEVEPVGPPESRFQFVGSSSDLRHVVFETDSRQLTADGLATSQRGVYEWADGQVRYVSKLPSGEAVQASAGSFSNIGAAAGQFYPGDHLISEDGQRIYFTVGPANANGALYVREGGATTLPVSVSERSGDDPSAPHPGTFHAAKADDGSLALFSSATKLTDDATACDQGCSGATLLRDLYLWNRNAPAGQRLTDLTTGDADGAGVLGITAAADDLSRVYFVATGGLAAGAIANAPNVYVWSAESGVRYIATLGVGDGGVWSLERDAAGRQYRDARVDADGSHLLFASHARLTAHDNGGTKQIYVYDADADRLSCASCGATSVSTGHSWLFYPPDLGSDAVIQDPRVPYRLPRNLSSDGERAFFETEQALVGADTNGKSDVYMWSDGEVSLISTGKAGEGSKFIDSGANGSDVFFTTRERLVPADSDNQVDVYDARVGGGIPKQHELPQPPCLGDECQPAFTAPPLMAAPGSPEGTGDPQIKRRSAFAVRRLSTKQLRALADGRKATLVVRVNKAGRVVVRGSARFGRSNRTVLGASKHARRAGIVKVPLRLSRAGMDQLTRSGRLRLSLRVRFTGAGKSESASFDLVRTSKNGRGR